MFQLLDEFATTKRLAERFRGYKQTDTNKQKMMMFSSIKQHAADPSDSASSSFSQLSVDVPRDYMRNNRLGFTAA